MFKDLLLIESYLPFPEAAQFEADLVDRYGEERTLQAIADGYLEHRRMPCGAGRERCICWLSEKGREEASKS